MVLPVFKTSCFLEHDESAVLSRAQGLQVHCHSWRRRIPFLAIGSNGKDSAARMLSVIKARSFLFLRLEARRWMGTQTPRPRGHGGKKAALVVGRVQIQTSLSGDRVM